ncbi:MAG: hypothetical protein GTN49_13060 [candidate division Zixibacteria bacterium]|nr:hypothetical protein [candidate division Zixibacteria bacterium]
MMKNATRLLTTTFLMAALGAGSSYADQPPGNEPSDRDAVRAAINEIKQKKVVDVLELEEEAEETFLGVYNRWEEVRWRYRERRAALMEELHLALTGRGTGRAVPEILDDIDDVDAENRGSEERLRAEFRSLLSDEQYAKLLLFEHNFNLKLRRLVQERQRKAGPGGTARER